MSISDCYLAPVWSLVTLLFVVTKGPLLAESGRFEYGIDLNILSDRNWSCMGFMDTRL